jgi:hypothetical protein
MTMRVYETRPLAIRAACEMLRDNNDEEVQVGPMLDNEPVLKRRRTSPVLRDYPGRTARPRVNTRYHVILPHPGLTVF